jgi:integrase
MKGLRKDQGGWRLQITPPGQERVRIRLGKMPSENAEAIAAHVYKILTARAAGTALALDTAEWLGRLPSGLYERLLSQGVLDESMARPVAMTLGEFCDLYFQRPDDRRWRTINQLKIASDNLLACFGPGRPLRSITEGEAKDFRNWLSLPRGESQKPWQGSTANRICGRAKEMFAYAKSRKFIDYNPFESVRGLTVRANPDTQFFVDRALTARIMDAMPDDMWRAIISLARFGGLRCPSETRSLRWENIKWDDGKIEVPCVKTRRHSGRAWRTIPLWPELRLSLEALRSAAEDDAVWVIEEYRSEKANPAVPFRRYLDRAGIPLYPKLMQNLRFSRAQELIDEGYPEHVVQAWIGHTASVAKEHYRMVTEEHFRRAVGSAAGPVQASNGKARVRSGSAGGQTDQKGLSNPKDPSQANRSSTREKREKSQKPEHCSAPENARERT